MEKNANSMNFLFHNSKIFIFEQKTEQDGGGKSNGGILDKQSLCLSLHFF